MPAAPRNTYRAKSQKGPRDLRPEAPSKFNIETNRNQIDFLVSASD